MDKLNTTNDDFLFQKNVFEFIYTMIVEKQQSSKIKFDRNCEA